VVVLDKSDLVEPVAAARETVRQLIVGEIEAVDVLQYQQTLGVDDDHRREPETARLFLRHDPQEAGGQQEDKRQPTVIRDAPDLHTDACILFTSSPSATCQKQHSKSYKVSRNVANR